MTTTFRISEVAQRSGFSPATLRYYEELGLVAPPARSDAGYRLYDEASVQRLRFIGRAKQLGCTLDEIAELLAVCDAEGVRCEGVQARLRELMDAKIADAQRRIAELTALSASLADARDCLGIQTADGPCDDDCGCLAPLVPLGRRPEPTVRPEL
jgi:DNA-binding transcriptional MerR regulator